MVNETSLPVDALVDTFLKLSLLNLSTPTYIREIKIKINVTMLLHVQNYQGHVFALSKRLFWLIGRLQL